MAGVLEGLERVLANLNKEIAKKQEKQMAGMMAAGLLIQRRSQKLVPREKGILHASAYTRKDGPAAVVVGYGASYALAVHENLEAKLKGTPRPSGLGVYWGPSGQPKFLEQPFREGKKDILETIASYTKAK